MAQFDSVVHCGGTSWWAQEREVAGHIASTVGKQITHTHAGAQLVYWVWF